MANTTRPFHETIVDAIKRCSGPSTGEITHLLKLIEETTIPSGHNEIIEAIRHYFDFPGGEKWARVQRIAIEDLERRKGE